MAQELAQVFTEIDGRIRALEARIARGEALDPGATVDETLSLAKSLMRAHRADRLGPHHANSRGSSQAGSDDALEVFKAFVKGEPSLNAIRDNVRELVYYRNCLDQGRLDALPPKPAVMAVRTLRHIYLYLRSRALQVQHRDAD